VSPSIEACDMNNKIAAISFPQVIATMFNGREGCPQENAEWCLLSS
jgi:hypothetical protein